MVFKFTDTDRKTGKLADLDIIFTDGDLRGLKLVGFAIWERANGKPSVTFPARQYKVGGESRSYALLRPAESVDASNALRDAILQSYDAYVAEKNAADG